MSGEKMSEHCSSPFDIQICQIVDPGEGRQHNDSSQVVTPANIPLTPCTGQYCASTLPSESI